MTRSIKRWIKVAVGLAISIACLAFIFSRTDLDALLLALGHFQWVYLIAALAALAFDYSLRVVRWSIMLRATGAKVTASECAPAFLGSMALNNVLPFRAGDVIRALVFPASLGITRSTSTASLVLERLVDLLTLLACLGIGLALSPEGRIPGWQIHTVALLSVVGSITLLATIVFSGFVARFLGKIATYLAGRDKNRFAQLVNQLSLLMGNFARMSRPRVLLAVGGLSFLIWFGEAGLFLALLYGFNITATPGIALVIMALATLATLVPSSPGYVGPFHLAAFSSVLMFGGSEAQAAGFSVLAHLALWIPVTLAGLAGIAANPGLFRQHRMAEDTP